MDNETRKTFEEIDYIIRNYDIEFTDEEISTVNEVRDILFNKMEERKDES